MYTELHNYIVGHVGCLAADTRSQKVSCLTTMLQLY